MKSTKSNKRKPSNSPRSTRRTPKHQQNKRLKSNSTIKWNKVSSSLLPQFLDAESSVTAAKFGARRLPEMKSLWRDFVCSSYEKRIIDHVDTVNTIHNKDTATSYHESGGCKISSRHLRRRTGSHNRKKRHRFPNGYSETNSNEQNLNEKNNQPNIQMSRKARRKPSLMKQQHTQWKNSTYNISDPNDHNCNVSNWLETHLWHSKRFIMSPPLSIYNNWCIPLGHSNRGSRAALRLAKLKCTVQDATWTIGGRSLIIESDKMEHIIHLLELICGGKKKLSAPFLLDQNVLLGLEVAHGYIYHFNSFPSGMVGPATFQFGRGDNELYYSRIVIDVTIQYECKRMLLQLIADLNEKLPEISLKYREEPIAFLKVRGLNATSAVEKSLNSQNDRTNMPYLDWGAICHSFTLHTMIKEKTIVISDAVPQTKTRSVIENTSENLEGKRQDDENIFDVIDSIHRVIKQQGDSIKANITKRSMILVSVCPSKVVKIKDKQTNISASGWDIWCHPDITNELFLALNHYGQACAIGIIEASTLIMDSSLHQPLWPRDFPDTYIGNHYWTNDNLEWKILRYCIEEGMHGGRIHTVLSRLMDKKYRILVNHNDERKDVDNISQRWKHHKIYWQLLNASCDKEIQDDKRLITVIRGQYIAPFVNALSKWCPEDILKLHSIAEKNLVKRRNRRKISGRNKFLTVPPLHKQSHDNQKKICFTLLSSLSIAALLRCHIVIDGKGKVSPAMSIVPYGDDEEENSDNVLGFVTSGMFSQSHGYYHGVGFISSNKFLSELSKGKVGNLALRRDESSSSMVWLKVRILNHITMDSCTGFLHIVS